MSKKTQLLRIAGLLVLCVVLVSLNGVHAQERGFTLSHSVIGSGSMGGSAGNYTIHSTLGQPVAGAVSQDSTTLTSGFWTWVVNAIEGFTNFLPMIMR